MNTIHDHIEDLMAAALIGGLSPEEQKSLDEHLAGCPSCRKLYQEEKMTASLLNETLSPDRPPMDFEDRMVRQFRRNLAKKESPFERVWLIFTNLCRTRYATPLATIIILVALVRVGSFLTNEPMLADRRRSRDEETSESFAMMTNGNYLAIGKIYFGPDGLDHPSKGNARHLDAARDQYALEKDLDGGNVLYVGGQATIKKPLAERIAELEAKLKEAGYTGVRGSGIKISGYVDTSYEANLADRDSSGAIKPEVAKKEVRVAVDPQVTTKATSGRDFSLPGGSVTLPLTSVREVGNKKPPSDSAGVGGKVVNDKVPFLGDIPMNGQLFQAKADSKATVEESSPSSTQSPSIALPSAQKLIRNASLEFEILSFESALDRVRAIAGEESGYIATSNSARLANGKVRGQVIVKVLPDHLDRFLLKLRALGDLKNQSIATQDVTKAYFDTEARMRNSKRMEERLLKMLDEAKGKVTEILVVEKELARVRESIEEMQGQLKLYDALVAYATVTLTMYEKDMNEPAAFILKEHADLGLFSPDVEKTFRDARHEAETAKGQIVQSKLERDTEGNSSATLKVLVAPENSEALLAIFKKLGRVDSLTWNNERVAQDGSGASDTARVEKDKVEIELTIAHDDASRQQESLAVVATSVEDALAKAKSAAAAQSAEVLSSILQHSADGHVAAEFRARVPTKTHAAFLASLKSLGRVAAFTAQRNDQAAPTKESEDAPVLLMLTLTDQEPAVQQTGLNVVATDVEAKAVAIKAGAVSRGAEVRGSAFEHATDGREVATFTFRVPMSKHAAFVDYLKGLGEVKDFNTRRQDQQGQASLVEADAPAEILFLLQSRGNIVGDESGFASTIRQTLSNGMGAMMWSMRMIGVALAFLLPWMVPVAAAGVVAWWMRRRKAGV